ncbi:MAG: hypothetical protein OXT67_00610 [Zetaproteobacteria bacterium]|nr:hypothetical protein [Zetaproteobacteria bacterium]
MFQKKMFYGLVGIFYCFSGYVFAHHEDSPLKLGQSEASFMDTLKSEELHSLRHSPAMREGQFNFARSMVDKNNLRRVYLPTGREKLDAVHHGQSAYAQISRIVANQSGPFYAARVELRQGGERLDRHHFYRALMLAGKLDMFRQDQHEFYIAHGEKYVAEMGKRTKLFILIDYGSAAVEEVPVTQVIDTYTDLTVMSLDGLRVWVVREGCRQLPLPRDSYDLSLPALRGWIKPWMHHHLKESDGAPYIVSYGKFATLLSRHRPGLLPSLRDAIAVWFNISL